MRALGCLLTKGSHRNIVKSSDPETNLSGALPFILLYLSKAAYMSDEYIINSTNGEMTKNIQKQKQKINSDIFFLLET